MTHRSNLATGKLYDPILMDRALDRYRQAREGRSPRGGDGGRSASCPCGSGKKYKMRCLAKHGS
jgi:uncharacterized protein YecA (UPF0149 family)